MRDKRLAEVNAKRLSEIQAGIAKMKKNQQRVKEHRMRQASAENKRIDSDLQKYNEKIQRSKEIN